jgi:hypothetical protein
MTRQDLVNLVTMRELRVAHYAMNAARAAAYAHCGHRWLAREFGRQARENLEDMLALYPQEKD